MTETLKLTRRGWIGHLAVVQEMLGQIWSLYETPTHRSVMGPKDCEKARRDKISKKFLELRELIWETSAVSEKWSVPERLRGRSPLRAMAAWRLQLRAARPLKSDLIPLAFMASPSCTLRPVLEMLKASPLSKLTRPVAERVPP